jgi:hypothetical protein
VSFFFFLLANNQGVSDVAVSESFSVSVLAKKTGVLLAADTPSCVLLHDKPQSDQATFEHSNVGHNLKPSRVLGQFSSANALEVFDDHNSFRNASQLQPPSVPNANGPMSQGNGSNTRNRYVINENEV